MAFSRTILAWAAVTMLFLLWGEAERRLAPGSAGTGWKAGLPAHVVEALLLTMFAGLWFGSLGSGGALLLFLVVGLLMELPYRIRRRNAEPVAWKALLAGLIRIELAGVLLSLLLGSGVL